MLAKREDGDRNRHADHGPRNAPEKAPEEHSENHRERRDGKDSPGYSGLEIVADEKLNHSQTDEHDRHRLPRIELGQCEEAREDSGHERPDERNVVQREGDDAPSDCEFEPCNKSEGPNRYSRTELAGRPCAADNSSAPLSDFDGVAEISRHMVATSLIQRRG